MRFLVDTNVISELFRARPNGRVVRRMAVHEGHAAMAAVTWHELRFGVERLEPGARKDALRRSMREVRERFPVLEYDDAAAEWHALERARLLARGMASHFADAQIAAIAATRELALVTANTKDFRRYRGLTLVDWSR